MTFKVWLVLKYKDDKCWVDRVYSRRNKALKRKKTLERLTNKYLKNMGGNNPPTFHVISKPVKFG